MLKINFPRLKETIAKSSEIGKTSAGGLCRLALSHEDKMIRDVFTEWMKGIGLDVRIDAFGNMFGRREGKENVAPILIGSHLDTQPKGGKYDGVLGVLTALEVLRVLEEQEIETTHPIEIVNFTNEEGARFEPALLGSGAATNVFTKQYVYERTDKDGVTFKNALEEIGYLGDDVVDLSNVHAFVELHIEQGPVLEKEAKKIGVVQGIKGMSWLEFSVTGDGGHAGPTPMNLRKDAFMASASFIHHLKTKAKEYADLSITIGRMKLSPNVVNCIPDQVIFSLDVRHEDDKIRKNFIAASLAEMENICLEEEVNFKMNPLWEVDTTNFHKDVISEIQQAADDFNFSTINLYSGAGHDAKYMSDVCPVGMIFLPSIGGISHVEHELSLDQDIEDAANVLLKTVLALDKKELK